MKKLLIILFISTSYFSFGQVVTDHGFKKDTSIIRIIPKTFVADSIWFDGTSITAGTVAVYTGLRFSSRVSYALDALESNHGASGARMYVEGLNSLHMGSIPVYTPSKYRYMVLEWGFNDMQFNVIDTGTFAAAYLRYIDTAIARQWDVTKILILSPSYGDSSVIGAGASMARQVMFNTCVQSIAARRGTLYLNTFGTFLTKGKELLLVDGIHPNMDGVTVGFVNPILYKLKDSVSVKTQSLQINGLSEFQKLKYRVTDTATRTSTPLLVDSIGMVVRGDNTTFIRNGTMALQAQAASIDLTGTIATTKTITGLYGVFTGEQPTGVNAPTVGSVRLGYSSGLGLVNALTGTSTGLPLLLNNVGLGEVRVHAYDPTGGAVFGSPSGQFSGYMQVLGGTFPSAGGGTTISLTPNGSATILARNWASSTNLDMSIQSLGGKIAFGALDPIGTINYQFTGTGYFSTSLSVGTTSTAASSILELSSTTKGFLLPRMTKTQRDAISSPVAGLAVYQTDNTPGLRVYNGTNWMRYTETTD